MNCVGLGERGGSEGGGRKVGRDKEEAEGGGREKNKVREGEGGGQVMGRTREGRAMCMGSEK